MATNKGNQATKKKGSIMLLPEIFVKKVAKHYRLAPELASDLERTSRTISMSETAIVEDALRTWLFSRGRELMNLHRQFKQAAEQN